MRLDLREKKLGNATIADENPEVPQKLDASALPTTAQTNKRKKKGKTND
jgi:hypothetical protein